MMNQKQSDQAYRVISIKLSYLIRAKLLYSKAAQTFTTTQAQKYV